jgi:hypothetical protein
MELLAVSTSQADRRISSLQVVGAEEAEEDPLNFFAYISLYKLKPQ